MESFMLLYCFNFIEIFRSLFCIALFLMCGTVGSWGASVFVKKIYRNVKIDWSNECMSMQQHTPIHIYVYYHYLQLLLLQRNIHSGIFVCPIYILDTMHYFLNTFYFNSTYTLRSAFRQDMLLIGLAYRHIRIIQKYK